MDDDTSESEHRYQQLIETSPAPINLFDSDGEIIWGNDAVVELLGLDSRMALIGRSIFEFIHPDDRYTAKRELVEVVDGKNAAGPTTMALTRDDGSTRAIRVATAPGRYRGRDVGQAVVIDITQLQEVQAELEAERRYIEDALDTLQDVFYVIDPGGELVRWNESLEEVSGYEPAEIRNMDIEEFFQQADVDRVSESIATVFVEGEDVLEATVVTKHGTEIPYEFRKRRISTDSAIAGVVGIGRDVSRRNARDKHLRAVDRLLQHGLRNQLNVIQGNARELRDTVGPEASTHIDRIETATDRLLSTFENHHHIVDQLTAQEGLESIDVVSVLEAIVRRSREAYPAATISSDLPETAPATAVPVLERACLELVTNAIEHNDTPEPTIEITATVSESTVTISVLDDGPAIPEMEYAVMADDDALSPTFHSTGLGLWFVHWVVERSDGKLTFDQRPADGNAVTIELRTPKTPWVAPPDSTSS